MSIDEQIAVMQAFKDGAEIQGSRIGYEDWGACENPSWNWSEFRFRVKPKPKTNAETAFEQWEGKKVRRLKWAEGEYFLPQKLSGDKSFVYGSDTHGYPDTWAFDTLEDWELYPEPKTRPLTVDDYNGEPIRMAEFMARHCPMSWNSIGIKINEKDGEWSYQDFFDRDWEYYKDGKWQKMEVTE